jgi:hypothetical protein
MVSSSIRGLEASRAAIREAVDALQLADSWLFESDATAAGARPEAQYLEKARDCDLFVLVVGSTIRPGTRDEYDAAFADNPNKILPVFLDGDVGDTKSFRDEVRDRHTVRRASEVDLPAEVAQAVEHAVRTGELSRGPLRASVASQQASLRALLSLPIGTVFGQRLKLADGRQVDAASGLTHRRLLLEGEPGSGKTDASFTALLAESAERIPVPTRAQPGATFVDLIEATFESVRYTPGQKGIRQLLRDGRLAVALDGIDELPAADRRRCLADVADAGTRYPRTRIVLVVRSVSHPGLADWTRASVEPLNDDEVEHLFDLFGHRGEQRLELFSRLQDLVRLPFWAPAVARFGLSATSGPDLLADVVGQRLRASLPDDETSQQRLVHALGRVAFSLRPGVEDDAAGFLDLVTEWSRTPAAQERFTAVPAETVLDLAASTGIVVRVASKRRFVHPLIAAYLASRHALTLDNLAQIPLDDDVRALIAAQLPDARGAEWADLMSGGSLGALVRALRLAGFRSRASDVAADLRRYEYAFKLLSALAGAVLAAQAASTTTSAVIDRDTFCLRRVPGGEPNVERGVPLPVWLARQGSEEFTAWLHNPFESRTPEQLAGEQVVAAMKALWNRLNPGGSPWAPFGADAQAVIEPRDSLADRALAHTRAVADGRSRLIEASGLRAWLSPAEGEPEIRISLNAPDRGYAVTWGHPEAAVNIVDGPEVAGPRLTRLLIDPDALAYKDLSDELDSLIGGGLRSGSVRGPSPLNWSL